MLQLNETPHIKRVINMGVFCRLVRYVTYHIVNYENYLCAKIKFPAQLIQKIIA